MVRPRCIQDTCSVKIFSCGTQRSLSPFKLNFVLGLGIQPCPGGLKMMLTVMLVLPGIHPYVIPIDSETSLEAANLP